jgi:hypothetical protein
MSGAERGICPSPTGVQAASSITAAHYHMTESLSSVKYEDTNGSEHASAIASSSFGMEDRSEVPDPAIIDALKNSKERLFVLRLGEEMELFIQDRGCVKRTANQDLSDLTDIGASVGMCHSDTLQTQPITECSSTDAHNITDFDPRPTWRRRI